MQRPVKDRRSRDRKGGSRGPIRAEPDCISEQNPEQVDFACRDDMPGTHQLPEQLTGRWPQPGRCTRQQQWPQHLRQGQRSWGRLQAGGRAASGGVCSLQRQWPQQAGLQGW